MKLTPKLPFFVSEEVASALIETITHPPQPGDEAVLTWAPRLIDLDIYDVRTLDLGAGFAVLFHTSGSRPPDSFYEITPGCRISISDRTLEQLQNKTLHYVTRQVVGRAAGIRVLTASITPPDDNRRA
jgi:hypothetical protein